MKKLLFLVFLFVGGKLSAQIYNNEWIDYSKTYYKFSVGKDGLYRINQASLQASGLGTTPAEQFQLYRNGQQVPIYTSVTTGTLGSTGYIEFIGKMNDGLVDTALYSFKPNQLNKKWSLTNDTAAYFLTINTNTAQNLRLANTANNVAGNSLPKETNFMYTVGAYEKSIINPGFAAVVGEHLHASSYDKGEGWSSNEIFPGSPFLVSFTNLYPDLTATVSPTYTIGASGNALFSRTVQTNINGNSVLNQVMDYFDGNIYSSTFPLSHLTSGTANLSTNNTSSNGNDRMVVAYQEITYPRLFNFGNQSIFEFELAANPAGNYLEITNFNVGGSIPVLYDLTNGKRYVAVVGGGLLKFALAPSAIKRNLALVNQDNSNVVTVSNLQTRNFTNFVAAANQGDYLIISSKILHNNTTASNPVEKYKAYRASVTGGSFNPKIIDADDLYDQYSFGIEKHPSSIRNYLRHARTVSSIAPKYVLIIGRGTSYNEARTFQGQPYLDILNHVPTFGYPASDNLLSAAPGTSTQTTPIGRIGAVYQYEVDNYLSKVKEYEQKQADMNFTIANKAWMLNGTFVSGSSEPFLQGIIDNYQLQYMSSWRDTFAGGATNLFTKTQAGGVVPLSNSFMESLWNNGHSLVQYFGHSSATTLEFNLDDPNTYSNQGKYPMMIINGCNAGNYFIYNPFRITTNNNQSLSEKFVLTPNKGSIGFIASTHFGVVNYLHYLNLSFFRNISTTLYGSSIGNILKASAIDMFALTGNNDFYAKMHAEQTGLQGDPAVKMNVSYPKPDYVIEDQTVKINPSFISIAENNFTVKMMYMNLAKAVNDSFNISVKRQYPSGQIETVYNQRVKAAYYSDSMSFNFNIIPTRDKGLNKITICLDADNQISEMSELNNCVTKDVFIFEDEARPVHPYNYAIVNQLPLKLVASTANPTATNRTYNMEMDTTEFFNSPLKVTQSLTQVGGVLEFTPINSLINNTVYYWRVSPQVSSGPVNWNTSSFTYINGSTYGFNQGHVFQHFKSDYLGMRLDSSSRKFIFDSIGQNISIRNGVWPTAAYEEAHLTVSVNQDPYIRSFCGGDRIGINVFSPQNGKPWFNTTTAGAGMFNSLASNCGPGRGYNFEYDYSTRAERNKANAMLLNNIPNGHYVIVRNITFSWTDPSLLLNSWKLDAAQNGNGQSLYNTLKAAGFNSLDSFYTNRSWIFVYKKGVPSYPAKSLMSEGVWDRLSMATDFTIPDSVGYITSPAFGPAKEWKEVHWRGNTVDVLPGDEAKVTLLGIRPNGVVDSLTTLSQAQLDYNIQSINALQYPYLKLRMKNKDSINGTPWQLDYWRLNYTPIPEGALAPNITLQIKDSVDVGENLQVKVAFKNISYVPFDSIKVKMVVLDQAGVSTTYVLPKQKPLAVGEVLTLDYIIPTTNYSGINTLFVDFNTDNDQPEQYHFNNFLYKNFYVRPDNFNPLLDVTFDGLHILNKDIVSASPSIQIKLKDESKFLALDDTTGLKVQLRFPGSAPGVLKTYAWNTDTLRFIPANLSSGDNTATAELKPKNLPDGEYELIVKGKDKKGNTTGELEYKVLFTVINKPMISNLLNYPNPFTSSTAFVFTITGNEVPQNIKIEIMTITGKIVREITKNELGPLRVGRNITEFKWDGTDQYGAKLANGVYLYRVVTNLNGKSLEKYKVGTDDKTDQYFNKGYGKMVIIR
jgi:Peptidase family C25